jgi:hypothetical protein
MSYHKMSMDKIYEDLRHWCKAWNQSTSMRLIVSRVLWKEVVLSIDASISGISVLGQRLFAFSLERQHIWINPELLRRGCGLLSGPQIHRLLSDMVEMAWAWKPVEVRGIFANYLQSLNNLYPWFGYGPDRSRIRWTEHSTMYEVQCDIDDQISRCFHEGDPCYRCRSLYAYIYRQDNPIGESVEIQVTLPGVVRRAARAPRAKDSDDLSTISDEEAEEGCPTCVVCMTNKPCVAPSCNHLSTCAGCAQKISKGVNARCPKCRGPWVELKRIFI